MAISKQTGDVTELTLEIHAETDKAWLLSDDGVEKNAKWSPKSQVERGDKKGTATYEFTLPEWLAKKNGWI